MMFRKALVLLGGVGLLLVLGGEALAQEWPYYPPGEVLDRGPGHYLAWYKIVACLLLVFFWVRTTDWINHDTFEIGDNVGMPAQIWNPIVVFTFLVALLLAITLPLFVLGYALLVVAYVVPLTTYIVMRNGRVTDEQKVLTREHIKKWLKGLASGKQRKKQTDTLASHEQGPPVHLSACGGSDSENQAHLIMARQSPGYVLVKEIMADAVDRRATRIMLDYTKEAVEVRYDVDGIWHNVEPREREAGDVMLAVMKKIAGLNMDERRARQAGEFKMKYRNVKSRCELVSQGTKTGERAIVEVVPEKMPFKSLENLGMRDKMRDDLKACLAEHQGLVVFSALPLGGLQTLWNVGLTETDRYLRDFSAVEDKRNPFTHVENVEVFTFDGGAGQTPDNVLRPILLREPDVVVCPDFVNGATVDALCDYVQVQNRLVATSVRAKDGIEALLRIMALKPKQPEKFAATVTAVVNQRLVRLLCETCRQAYEPSEQLLKKLGIPKGRVEVLFNEFQPPPPGTKKKRGEPEVCPDCSGLFYKGRTAIFEFTKITDEMRKALVERPRPEVLQELSHKAGNRTLLEEGVLLVARGATSVNELQRVLKQ
jgi:type II secretory ATPase GspE/PulE/Tfp pilus assembly ATPase PilB-like protein